jgi:hypothetical protein
MEREKGYLEEELEEQRSAVRVAEAVAEAPWTGYAEAAQDKVLETFKKLVKVEKVTRNAESCIPMLKVEFRSAAP